VSPRARPAIFFDRDGTIIEDRNYIADPSDVVLLPSAADALRRLNAAGVPVVIVTNQSGIARGYYDMAAYDRVRKRMEDLLANSGAHVDATYVCPHHPDFSGPCDCRKPATLLFQRAAKELDLDLGASWYVGDKLRDILPARALGGHGILVPTSQTPPSDIETAGRDFVVAESLDAAIANVIESPR